MTTRDRLEALLAEAGRQSTHFEKRRENREAFSKVLNATIALSALLMGFSATNITTLAAIALGTWLLMAIGLNLALTDTQRDRDLQRLGDAWERHRTDAARLLAREGAQRSADAAQEIERNTVELECRIAQTRSDSLLHGLASELPPAPAAEHDPEAPPPASRKR